MQPAHKVIKLVFPVAVRVVPAIVGKPASYRPEGFDERFIPPQAVLPACERLDKHPRRIVLKNGMESLLLGKGGLEEVCMVAGAGEKDHLYHLSKVALEGFP